MEAVEKYRITSVLTVPTMVLALIDHPRFGDYDLSSLEVIFYGASAFPAARLKDAIDRLGQIFFARKGGDSGTQIGRLRRQHTAFAAWQARQEGAQGALRRSLIRKIAHFSRRGRGPSRPFPRCFIVTPIFFDE
jgi:acyl-CoA synthetase (AMP-forming)/AMP-acid ligase II